MTAQKRSAPPEDDLEQFAKPWLPRSPPPVLVIENAKIIDTANGTVIEQGAIWLADGLIKGVASGADAVSLLGAPKGAVHVDIGGKYVCPGLIDAHVHINAVPGGLDLGKTMTMPEDQIHFRMGYVCRNMLYRGFTTVRDCGGAPYALQEACAEWAIPGPRLNIAGHAISQTGGHGDFRSSYDHGHPGCCGGATNGGFINGLGRVADGVPACLQAGRDEIRCGANFLKIMGGGGVASPTDRLEHLQYTPEEIQAFVSVAENAGTYVTCHAYTPASIAHAINNGVRGIEHGNLLDRPTAELMASRGAYLTPTLIALQAMADETHFSYLPPSNRDKNNKVLAAGLEALRLAHECGVTMCYGSDLLGPLGRYQADEFAIRAQALPAVSILQSATINPARMMGLDKVAGQIATGFEADLIVLESNPLDDITVLGRSETELMAVFRSGRVVRDQKGLFGGGLLDSLAKM